MIAYLDFLGAVWTVKVNGQQVLDDAGETALVFSTSAHLFAEKTKENGKWVCNPLSVSEAAKAAIDVSHPGQGVREKV